MAKSSKGRVKARCWLVRPMVSRAALGESQKPGSAALASSSARMVLRLAMSKIPPHLGEAPAELLEGGEEGFACGLGHWAFLACV